MERVQALSEAEIEAGMKLINEEAAKAGLDPAEFLKLRWEERAGMVRGMDYDTSQQNVSLIIYLSSTG